MKNKLLIICGPTATGKTKLALHLAKLFGGVLISADSRQVYKYMNIGTGKGDEKIFGYDLVNPNEDFSVSQYTKYAREKIEEIWRSNKLPILVGGTGLYIKAVVDGMETLDVPRNKELRKSLMDKAPERLFNLLVGLDPIKAASMNQSDAKNPRRLIRAIEVAQSKLPTKKKGLNADLLWVGLTSTMGDLSKKINNRVQERIKIGFEKEFNFLKNEGMLDGVTKHTLGYKDWPDIQKWKREEIKYAKRQLVWFRKEKRIKWFNVNEKKLMKNIEKLVKKWYSSNYAKEN